MKNHKHQLLFLISVLLYLGMHLGCKSEVKSHSEPIQHPVAAKPDQVKQRILETPIADNQASASPLSRASQTPSEAHAAVTETGKNQAISGVNGQDNPVKSAQKTAKPKRTRQKPVAKFERIKYDFGTITQGDTVDYQFIFTNTGKGPLVVNSAKATYGCTQPSYPFIPIEAGEEGYIGVKYVSVGKEGNQKPLITVYTNASKEPITLMLTGNVEVEEKIEKDSKKVSIDSTKQSTVNTMKSELNMDSLTTLQDTIAPK